MVFTLVQHQLRLGSGTHAPPHESFTYVPPAHTVLVVFSTHFDGASMLESDGVQQYFLATAHARLQAVSSSDGVCPPAHVAPVATPHLPVAASQQYFLGSSLHAGWFLHDDSSMGVPPPGQVAAVVSSQPFVAALQQYFLSSGAGHLKAQALPVVNVPALHFDGPPASVTLLHKGVVSSVQQ